MDGTPGRAPHPLRRCSPDPCPDRNLLSCRAASPPRCVPGSRRTFSWCAVLRFGHRVSRIALTVPVRVDRHGHFWRILPSVTFAMYAAFVSDGAILRLEVRAHDEGELSGAIASIAVADVSPLHRRRLGWPFAALSMVPSRCLCSGCRPMISSRPRGVRRARRVAASRSASSTATTAASASAAPSARTTWSSYTSSARRARAELYGVERGTSFSRTCC